MVMVGSWLVRVRLRVMVRVRFKSRNHWGVSLVIVSLGRYTVHNDIDLSSSCCTFASGHKLKLFVLIAKLSIIIRFVSLQNLEDQMIHRARDAVSW